MTYHRKDRPNQAVIDKGIDAAVFHHGPGVLRSRNISFAIQSNMGESIAIDEPATQRQYLVPQLHDNTYCTAQSIKPIKQPKTQKAIEATMLPPCASCC